VAVDREKIERDERHRDLEVAVQHAFAEQRPVGRPVLVERDEFPVEDETTRERGQLGN